MSLNDHDEMTRDITTDAFDSDWNATDITHLQPGNLARSKPVRGWERKPASPFTKQRLRVGKVWRRAFPASRAGSSNATGQAEERTIKRLREGQSTQSPLKIVKRLCLGANDGVGIQWDKIESPTKRIVTRSSATSNLIALPDEEEEESGSGDEDEEDVEGTVVEILDEDGRILQVGADEAQNNEDWLDDDAQDESTEEQSDDDITQTERENQHVAAQDVGSVAKAGSHTEKPVVSLGPVGESVALPAGFVSPLRQKRPLSRRASLQAAETNRRRTLPRTFAPLLSTEVAGKSEDVGDEDQAKEEQYESDISESGTNQEQPLETETGDDPEEDGTQSRSPPSDNDVWEDVEEPEDELSEPPEIVQQTYVEETAAPQDIEDTLRQDTDMEDGPLSPTSNTLQHPDLPLRRSPRRKSSSPLKQRSFQAFVDATPHLVAFSPVKGRLIDDEIAQDAMNESPFMLERSVSAPPEEPQMPERRSAKPRVSDDTALLQAFLNRAAQNKSTRRLSASKRESLSNRRDSDTIRQALASPAKPEILGALDPNSPSPKKSMAVLEDPKLAHDDDPSVNGALPGSGNAEVGESRTTRRSHRDKRRVERAAPLAQTRISLRGNTDPVILKRSEAQELATTTRGNTRKNKGGSIMPTLRLSKLIVEKPPIETSPDIEEDTGAKIARPGVRNVQWDETLAYYQEAPSEPEVQLFELGDSKTAPKLQGPPPPVLDAEPESDEAVPAPVPAALTPSKPKVRKLRVPRTASTAGKAPPNVLSEELMDLAPPSLKQKQPRRSKIATSAKGQEASSSSPVDTAPSAPAQSVPTAARPKAVPRKKATSRLPAPAPLPSSSQENHSLIASPPKKKSTIGSLPTKNPAPKLDFQTKLSASSKPVSDSSDPPAGLASPAKRAGRSVAFGSIPAGPVFGAKSDEPEDRKVPGLSSPAKKRTRRAP